MINDLKYRYKIANPVLKLIYINIGVFFFVKIVQTISFLTQISNINVIVFFGLHSKFENLLFKPWMLFSYMLIHDELIHILFNMIWLYFSGKIFIQYFNHQKLYDLFIIGGITGGLCFLICYKLFPVFQNESTILIGASASVLALLFASASYVPNYKVNLMNFGSLSIKYIAIISVFIDIISIPKNNPGGHIAHIGGALIGLIFIYQWRKGNDITMPIYILRNKIINLFVKKNLKTIHKRPKNDDTFLEEKINKSKKVDKLLDKISQSGYDSLTKIEKDYLFNESKNL